MPIHADIPDVGLVEFPDDATPEEIAKAVNTHYGAKAQPGAATKKPPGALETFGEHAAVGVGPGAAFALAAPSGAKYGAALGAMVPGADATGIPEAAGAIIGGLITGGAASWAAYKAQHATLKALAPKFTDEMDKRLSSGAEAHPVSAIAGDVVANLPSMKASIPKLAQLPFRAALGGTAGAVMPLAQGRLPTKSDVAEGAIMGSVLGEPRWSKATIPGIPKSADILPRAKAAAVEALNETPNEQTGKEAAAGATGDIPSQVQTPPRGGETPKAQNASVAAKVAAQTEPLKGNWTTDALQYGASITTPEQLQELKQLEAQHAAELKATPKTLENFDKISSIGFKKQWFTEALQGAQGIEGSDPAAKALGADYKPPFPGGKPRVTEPPSTEAPSSAASPEPNGNVKVTLLDPHHQERLDMEAKAGGHNVRVEAEPIPADNPLARQIATIDRKTGQIVINPQQLGGWLRSRGRGGVPEGQERAAIRSLLGEEAIHLATPDDSALAYHDSTTAAERAIAQRVYGGKGGVKLSPTMLGHEMLRMRMQQLARMGVRETIEASNKERWTVKSLLALSDAIRTAREVIGTKASKEGGAITDRIQENLEAAIAAKAGEAPAARRKGQEEGTPEFYLPPIKSGDQRPGASEAGALPEVKIPPEQALQPDTVSWNKPNAWKRLQGVPLTNPRSLGASLTAGARVEGQPVSMTKRLVALEKDGKVDVVSIYMDAKDGARAVDPLLAGKRSKPNVLLTDLLAEGYKPIGTILRSEPVQNFHRHFDSTEHFNQTVGGALDEMSAQRPETPETAYESRGEGEAARPTQITQPTVSQRAPDVTQDARATHQAFSKAPSVVEAIGAIQTSANKRQIVSHLKKAIAVAMSRDPNLKVADAAEQAFSQIYEQAKSQTEAEFTADVEKEAAASPEHPGEQTVNDLGEPPAPEADTSPGAIRKYAEEQIKLTEDDIKAYAAGLKNEDELARTRDAAANIPNKVAAGEENNIRFASAEKPKGLVKGLVSQWTRGKPEVLAAAKALVQGQFNRGAIPTFKALTQQGIAEANHLIQHGSWREKNIGKEWLRSQNETMKELDYAEAHWNDPELQDTARRMKTALDQQWSRERAAGIEVQKDPNYLPGRYNASVWNEHSILYDAIKGTEKIYGGKYRQPKTFPTYYHAGAEGPYIPATADGASLVGHRVRQGMNTIERDAWVNGLKGINGPSGQPIAADVKILANGSIKTPGREYEAMMINGKNVAVHEDFASIIRNLTNPSALQDWAITRGALRLQELLKHTAVIGDIYHGFKTGFFAQSISRKVGWKAGWSALDIKPQNMAEAVSKGIISQSEADWANAPVRFGNQTISRRQLADKFIRSGANLGRIQDALYKDLISGVTPGQGKLKRGFGAAVQETSGRWNRFLFDNWTRGIMTEANILEFERQMKAKPEANPEAIMRDISRDVNNRFGNIGRQGWLKSATHRDLARLFFFAPQWGEGLMKSEAAFYGRASGASKLMGRREGVSNLGTAGRSVGKGLVFLLGLTQAINLLTKGQPTWKNDEGHKGDAWIPGRNGEPGFWFSPLSVFNETTHDLWRYAQGEHTVMNAVDTIIGNKESALSHALLILGVGATAGKGQHFTSSMNQLKAAGSQLAPMPLTFGRYAQAAGHAVAPSVVPPNAPGSLQRQTFSALGIKVEPKLDAASEVSQKAEAFAKETGIKKETGWQQVQTDEPSYSKLRSALRAGDESEAKRQYEALKKTRTETLIFKAMKLAKSRPFTGSKKGENAFIKSLDDRGLEQYQRAVQQRDKEYSQWENFALRQQ